MFEKGKWVLKNKVDYPMHLQVGPHSYIYDVDPDFNFAGEFIYQSAYTPIIKDILKDHPYETVLSSDLFNIISTWQRLFIKRYHLMKQKTKI